MAAVQISEVQANALSAQVVQRRARQLADRTDAAASAEAPDTRPAPPSAQRLRALHEVLRADLDTRAGPAIARHLAVDLAACAKRWQRALEAGAAWRENAAAAQMLASATLGLQWLEDERLWAVVTPPAPATVDTALSEPTLPDELRAWAEADWAPRFRKASQRNLACLPQARYALRRAAELGFTAESLRAVADASFDPDQADALAGFLAVERRQIASAGLDFASLRDRRVESLCTAADMVHGLGRFVRLAEAARPQAPDAATLFDHLRGALNDLAEEPQQ